MREFIMADAANHIKLECESDEDCCFVHLEGSKLKTKEQYFQKLSETLRLSDTFSNNFNAYADMMCDAFTYYNKEKIVFLIDHYDAFLSEDASKKIIETIFDEAIIPYFEGDIHVYCVGDCQ